jgi:hypothetical protein
MMANDHSGLAGEETPAMNRKGNKQALDLAQAGKVPLVLDADVPDARLLDCRHFWPRWLLLALLACLYVFVATRIDTDAAGGGPDELTRLLVPRTMLMGDLFPSGFDERTVFRVGGYSYAFYPQVLGADATALFMSVARLLGFGRVGMFIAARLASVAFSMVTLHALGRAARSAAAGRCDADLADIAAICLLGLWPQYVFLSGYVNNDIIGLCGASLCLAALVEGVRCGWDLRRSLKLACGVVVCALGYLNACCFALVAIVVYIVTVLLQYRDDRASGRKLIGIAALVAAVCTLPFFALSYVRYGDPLGIAGFEEGYARWLSATGTETMHPYEGSLWALFVDVPFNKLLYGSLCAMFGYMYVHVSLKLVALFYVALVIGILAACLSRRVRPGRQELLVVVSMVVAAGLTLFLAYYRSYTTDYQPQGRYIIDILVPLVVLAALGYSTLCELFARGDVRRRIAFLLVAVALYAAMSARALSVNKPYWRGLTLANPDIEYVLPASYFGDA